MNKRDNIIYYASTGLFSAVMAMSVVAYLAVHSEAVVTFETIEFPTWLIYPLAVVKILGLIAIWTNKSLMLKEWAYAGFLFDVLIALGAHIAVADGMYAPALACIVLIIISYIFNRKRNKTYVD